MEEEITEHEKLIIQQKKIYALQHEYTLKLNELSDQLKENKRKIYENCIKQHGHHEWEAFREDGPYGERYYICKNCNSENY
tara:strand:+ start:234 stop:476 length:243 start_codon:yes stop_codon:yes gene_type:complete